jgi:tetratricopeptide (TPR) repeat protein
MDRITMLKQLLAEHPNEALPRYGLAMEYATAGNTDSALAEFQQLLELHPDYANGYFMAAQTLARAGREQDARDYLQKGIAVAARIGDAHARSEMESMLEALPGS